MTTEKNLRDELLKHNGTSAQKADDLRQQILKKDEARVTRMRKLVVVAWAVLGAGLIAGATVGVWFPEIEDYWPGIVPASIVAVQALLLTAVVFTISLYIRERALSTHQIQTSLALIEEHLRRMAEK